jgi:hypothetical protein
MVFFDEIIIKDSIEIETTTEKIWGFFDNLEENYLSWHPEDHVACRWLKGRPHQIGSIAYFEEMLGGKLRKIKVKIAKVEKYKYSENKPRFPLSIFHPKGMYIIESKDNKCVFTAVNYFNIPKIFKNKFLAFAKIKALEKHMKEEGIILKRLLENRQKAK